MPVHLTITVDTKISFDQDTKTADMIERVAKSYVADATAHRVVEGEPTSFLININEAQRAMLTAALLEYAYPACFEKDDREELDLLALMLQQLPTDEKEYPGVIHGLCL